MTTTRCRRQPFSNAMPAEVQALGSPWPSLVGCIPGLTEELERDFRFGQSVIRMGEKYRIGGNLKGGTSMMWYPSNEGELRAYEGWRSLEGLPVTDDRTAFEMLLAFLEPHGIELRAGKTGAVGRSAGQALERRGWIFSTLEAVLSALPDEHLDRAELSGVQLGGWGPDASKASAYEDGWVLLYDFALEGARRTFLGLLVHELGHAQESAWPGAQRARLEALHGVLADHQAFVGVEFLLDGETRRILQTFSFGEFLAETYMVYVSQGTRLRSHVGSLEGPAREAWEEVYEAFLSAFGGREYV